jgi:hypothetical protein
MRHIPVKGVLPCLLDTIFESADDTVRDTESGIAAGFQRAYSLKKTNRDLLQAGESTAEAHHSGEEVFCRDLDLFHEDASGHASPQRELVLDLGSREPFGSLIQSSPLVTP